MKYDKNMKTFIPLLCAFLLAMSSFADTNKPSKPFEIILIATQIEYYAAGYATNDLRPMNILFRNVGDKTMGTSGPLPELSIIWDGKECKKDPKRAPYALYDGPAFSPMGSLEVPFSPFDFLIPKDALTPGWHTVSAKAEDVDSNPVSVFLFEGKK